MTTSATAEASIAKQPEARPGMRPAIPVGAWMALGLFFLGVDIVYGICGLAERSMPPGAAFLLRFVSLYLTWNWLEQECRPYGQTYPLDMGMFLAAIGFLLIPYYMWRNQRWWGVLKLGALVAMWVAMCVVAGGAVWAVQIMHP